LQELCFRLDVDWDSLSGDNKGKKARSPFLRFVSRGQLEQLRADMPRCRWPVIPAPAWSWLSGDFSSPAGVGQGGRIL
jgi:hypothetical protein